MKIVFLDSEVINPGDISWSPIEVLGSFENYKKTSKEEIVQRLSHAKAVFIDSAVLGRKEMEQCPNLKFIGIAATGYNHVDLGAAKERGIAVANVPAYSTDAVSQHAIALLMSITNQVERYNREILQGHWQEDALITTPLTLLAGKSIGIVGYGNIGKKVAMITEALGMKVHVYSRDPQAAMGADVVSLHCPLTEENAELVDEAFIGRMKDGAILINTARGGLIKETALAHALKSGKLAGAGLDVLAKEPPEEGNPLIGLNNCFITPHIGFIPVETRKIVVDTCGANLKSFIKGERLNRLV